MEVWLKTTHDTRIFRSASLTSFAAASQSATPTLHGCKYSLRDAFQYIAQPDTTSSLLDCILYLVQYSCDPYTCSQLLVSSLARYQAAIQCILRKVYLRSKLSRKLCCQPDSMTTICEHACELRTTYFSVCSWKKNMPLLHAEYLAAEPQVSRSSITPKLTAE